MEKYLNKQQDCRDLEEKPLCIFLNTYYDKFLETHYAKNSHLISASYTEQMDSLQGECFGDSDFYSEGLKKAGWKAEDLVVNCHPLQQAWARENSFSGDELEIAIEQIRRKRPQVVYLQDTSIGTAAFLSALRPHTELIVGQIASPVQSQTDIHGFDIVFSSFAHFVERFRRASITSYYQPLAFDSRVLEKLQTSPKQYAATFVGGMSPVHGRGQKILEELSELVPIDCWGYGAETLPPDSAIRAHHHGEVWGREMFSVLQRSRVTVNRHIDVAETCANNMRLYEATGCGAMLVTDYKDNLSELFEIGAEVVAYRTPQEAAALIEYYSRYPQEAEEIAAAGRERTVADHSYTSRMKQTAEILSRHLRYRRQDGRFPQPDMSRISYGLTSIQDSEVTEDLTCAWQSEDIPAKQRALVQKELDDMYKGKAPVIYRVLSEMLRPHIRPGDSVLEIGCASGYYYEILEYLMNKRIGYTGVDYSEPLISMARDYYPQAEFVVADGANLPFSDSQFIAAISSGVLIHVPNYRRHIAETARVAKEFVVAHRTPVCRKRATQYFKKFAYGIETVELCFNENEILSEFVSHGLKLIDLFEFSSNAARDEYGVTYLFRCTA